MRRYRNAKIVATLGPASSSPDVIRDLHEAGADPSASLAANDSYGVFAAIGDLVVTGPTHTNVNDFRAILIEH